MTNEEQEDLFTALRKRHPDWPMAFVNGYVHGASDEEIRREPRPGYLSDTDQYALGYQRAWTDRRGA